MPLRDHFRLPVNGLLPWSTLLAAWASNIAERLNDRWLPKGYVARETIVSLRHPEFGINSYDPAIVVTADADPTEDPPTTGDSVREPTADIEWQLGRRFDVSVTVYDDLHAAIAKVLIVSPGNKLPGVERRAFANKVVTHLRDGLGVLIVDVVTTMPGNLHADTMALAGLPSDGFFPDHETPYAVAYRPKFVDERPRLDLWAELLTVGHVLPTMPLRLTGDSFVPVELEDICTNVCRKRRLM